jgi:hypothetical protein
MMSEFNDMFNKKIPEQSNNEFLKKCEIPEGTLEAMFALKVRKQLAVYAVPNTKIKKAAHVFAHFKIENELGISHVDSLDLIDIILDFENDGMIISENEAKKIFKLNEKNANVSEIVNELIKIIKEKHIKLASCN